MGCSPIGAHLHDAALGILAFHWPLVAVPVAEFAGERNWRGFQCTIMLKVAQISKFRARPPLFSFAIFSNKNTTLSLSWQHNNIGQSVLLSGQLGLICIGH